MKKLILAMLLPLLLALVYPASALAVDQVQSAVEQGTVTAELSVAAVSRDTTETLTEDGLLKIKGTVTYVGTVTSATRDSEAWDELSGATVVAQERIHYLVNPLTGDILHGNVKGVVTLFKPGSGWVIAKFQAQVWGNIYTGPAGDVGKWEVVRAGGPASSGLKARGDWVAVVGLVEILPDYWTFAGTVSMSGTYVQTN